MHNVNKEFKHGHTHVSNFYKAKVLVIMAIKREADSKLTKHDIESLMRITNDNRYRNQLRDLLERLEWDYDN